MFNFFKKKNISSEKKVENLLKFKKEKGFIGIEKFQFNKELNFFLFCNNDCPYTLNKIANNELFDEPNSLKIWIALSKNSKSIFDLGSHVGIYSIVSSICNIDSKIICVEPNPIVYSRLLCNLFINKSSNTYPVFGILSNSKQNNLTKFNYKNNKDYLSTAGTLVNQNNKNFTSYFAKNFNIIDIIKSNNITSIDLIKMDVEGAEIENLKIIENLINKNTKILIEVLQDNFELKEYIISFARKFKFKIFSVDERKPFLKSLSPINEKSDFISDKDSRNLILINEYLNIEKVLDNNKEYFCF